MRGINHRANNTLRDQLLGIDHRRRISSCRPIGMPLTPPRTAASKICRASGAFSASGFSHITWQPGPIAYTAISQYVFPGVPGAAISGRSSTGVRTNHFRRRSPPTARSMSAMSPGRASNWGMGLIRLLWQAGHCRGSRRRRKRCAPLCQSSEEVTDALGAFTSSYSFLANDFGERITKSSYILCRGLPEDSNINGIIPVNEAIAHPCH